MLVRAGRGIARGGALVPAFRAVAADFLSGEATVARTGTATTYDPATGLLQAAAANTARFQAGAVLGRNSIRNPRGEGAAVGGAFPTHWSFNTSFGITPSVVGFGVDEGLFYVELRFQGTATGSGYRNSFETAGVTAGVQGQTFTHSVYAKHVAGEPPSGSFLQVEIREFAGGSPSGGLSGASIAPNGSWQRASYTRTLTDATCTNVQPTLRIGHATGTDYDYTLRFAGPQLEMNSAPTQLSLPPVGTPAASELRRPGSLLVEEGRTNFVPNSLSSGVGNGATGNTSAASTDIPAFLTGATVWKHVRADPATQPDNNSANVTIGTPGAGQTITISCWAWVPASYAGTVVGIAFDGAASNISATNYDLTQKGTWQRITRTSTTAAGATGSLNAQLRPTGAQAGNVFYTTCWQCEIGAFATSHVPTSGAAAVRAADQIGFPLGAWHRPGAGTVVVRALLPNQTFAGLALLDDNSSNNRIVVRNFGGNLTAAMVVGGATVASATGGTTPIGASFTCAMAWDANGIAACLNGGAVATAASAPPTGLATLRIGQNETSNRYANGTIERVDYYARRLSDADLRRLTA